MSRCFVIQPFDKAKFDKRFDAIFKPAIIEAGLEPYRVDKDQSVEIPIQAIEAGIRESDICLADITTDNPNVWYELGYAMACGKDVLMVCSAERVTRFPFDVQHRRIITYSPESPQDFDNLKRDIVSSLEALMKKKRDLQTVSSLSPLKDTEGLTSHEVVTLVSIMERAKSTGTWIFLSDVLTDVQRAGYSEIAGTLSAQSLTRKQMIEMNKSATTNTPICRITNKGIDWLLTNQVTLKLTSD